MYMRALTTLLMRLTKRAPASKANNKAHCADVSIPDANAIQRKVQCRLDLKFGDDCQQSADKRIHNGTKANAIRNCNHLCSGNGYEG